MLSVLKLYEQRYLHDDWHKKIVEHEGKPFIERPFKIELCTVPVNGTLAYQAHQLVSGWTQEEMLTTHSDFPSGKRPYWFQKEQMITHCDSETYPLPVRNLHIIFTGRIDTALHDSNLIWVMDNKTSSMGGKRFEDAFQLSLQTRGYTWALQKILGVPVAGLIMNALVIKPPTLKVQNNTELTRHTYFYTQDSLDEWEENMSAIVSDLVHCLVRGYFPQTGRSFKSPCDMCDYSTNCSLPRPQRAADLSSELFRDVTWSPIH